MADGYCVKCKAKKEINDIPGVITVGLFAIKPADVVLIAYDDETKVM